MSQNPRQTLDGLPFSCYTCKSAPMDKTPKPHYCLTLSPSLVLRPYVPGDVAGYHEWMADPQLLYFTSSERLTLQQEEECQRQWTVDTTRDTFIISKDNKPVGDVNIFFSEWLGPLQCEINVMIAQKQHRGKGIASQVIEAMERFGAARGRSQMVARIKEENVGSQKLFKKLGFGQAGFNKVQREFEFRKELKETSWEQFRQLFDLRQSLPTQHGLAE